MDHESVNIRNSTMSCGVMELSRIDSDIEKVLYCIASTLYHPSRGSPCAFFVWSDVWIGEENVPNAERLSELIDNKGLGIVDTCKPAENPRTGNMILVYIWTIHHARFKAWYRKERVKKMRKMGR